MQTVARKQKRTFPEEIPQSMSFKSSVRSVPVPKIPDTEHESAIKEQECCLMQVRVESDIAHFEDWEIS